MLSSLKSIPRAFAFVALASGLAAAGACKETTHDDDEEPDIASFVITHGSSSVTVPASGTASGSLSLVAAQSNDISVRFLNAAGQDEPVIVEHRSDYEVRITAGTLTVTLTGGSGATFTGAITPPAGITAITVVLFNKDHNHEEMERTVAVTM